MIIVYIVSQPGLHLVRGYFHEFANDVYREYRGIFEILDITRDLILFVSDVIVLCLFFITFRYFIAQKREKQEDKQLTAHNKLVIGVIYFIWALNILNIIFAVFLFEAWQ